MSGIPAPGNDLPLTGTTPPMFLGIDGEPAPTAEAEVETSAATTESTPSSVAKANIRFMRFLSVPC